VNKSAPARRMATLAVAVLALTAIPFTSSAAADHSRLRVTAGNGVMILEYDFEEPDIVRRGDTDFVTINGCERYSRAGAPVIPVKPIEILVPPGMRIQAVSSKGLHISDLSGTHRLAQAQKPRRRTETGPATPTRPDPDIYETGGFWPKKHHELVTVQTNRGYNIAYINLLPLQYAPKSGKIRMATRLRLTIRFSEKGLQGRARPTRQLKKKLKRRIENPETLAAYDAYSAEAISAPAERGGTGSPLDNPGSPYYGANYKYVVITNNSLANVPGPHSFQSLCDSKVARGISAGIVTTEWIYANYDGTTPSGNSDDATRIRNFLMDAYQIWGTEYALLGGNRDIIPVRLLYDGRYDVPADLYYGCVDPPECTFDEDGDGKFGESNDGPGGGEVDLVAEIFVGRAAVENESEVVNFVKKTLVYQTIDDPYLNQAGTMGSWLGFGGIQEFTKPFAELIRLGSDLYLGHYTHGLEDPGVPNARDFAVATLYDEDWWNANRTPYYDSSTAGPKDGVKWDWNSMGWSATDDLLPFLNGEDGHTTPHLLYISDHGDVEWGMVKLSTKPTSWYNCDDLSKLHNTRPFFFYDDSCYVGAFDYADCFGEVITTMEHGAFACILNSRDGLGADGNTLDSPSTQMTREFFESVLGEGILELGRAHQEAKESCIWRLNSMSWLRYVYFELTLFGDPELQLRVVNGRGPSAPFVDAGVDMITWSGQPVRLDPNIVNNSEPFSPLTYAWAAEPVDGVVFDPNANVEAPTVTITKATENPSVVTLTVAVNTKGGIGPPVTDTMTIDVYDDACKAAIGKGFAADHLTDIDGNCITDLGDLAVMGAAWLENGKLAGAIIKP